MEEVLQFLQEAQTFYIATVEGDTPKVRPFGFVMIFEGRLYFCTNNTKDFYKQLMVNPRFEISATLPDYRWIRLCGKAVFDGSRDAKEKVFEVMPSLKDLYGDASNPIFEVFYLADGEAAICSMTEEKREISLR